MKNTPTQHEELSAWLDSEKHSCEKEFRESTEGLELQQDYQTIEATISKILAEPKASAEKINAIHQACLQSQQAQTHTFPTLKVVASIAALLVIGFSLYKLPGNKQETAQVAEDQSPRPTEAIKVEAVTPENNQELVFVGLAQEKSPQAKILLEDEISHVWLSETPQDLLNKILAKLPQTARVNQLSTSTSENISLQITLSDQELIDLVSYLSSLENSLLSQQEPQPEKLTEIYSNGKQVSYQLKILPKKK